MGSGVERAVPGPTFWAEDYGAGVPGDTPEALAANTEGMNAAIDAAMAAGGGVVRLPAGIYGYSGASPEGVVLQGDTPDGREDVTLRIAES